MTNVTKAVEDAFGEWLENVGEDAADDLISLTQDAFKAGWNARDMYLKTESGMEESEKDGKKTST